MKYRLTLGVGLLPIALVGITGQPRLPDEGRSTNFETRCGWFDNPTPANLA